MACIVYKHALAPQKSLSEVVARPNRKEMGTKFYSLVVLLVVFRPSESQNIRTLKLALDPKYTSLLPLSTKNYITELSSTPRMLCFLMCLQLIDICAGTVVNTDALQCKLMNSYLNGLILDVNNPVPGWSFWAVESGMAFFCFKRRFTLLQTDYFIFHLFILYFLKIIY